MAQADRLARHAMMTLDRRHDPIVIVNTRWCRTRLTFPGAGCFLTVAMIITRCALHRVENRRRHGLARAWP